MPVVGEQVGLVCLTLEEALTVNHARMAEVITDSSAAALLKVEGTGAYTAVVVITPGPTRAGSAG